MNSYNTLLITVKNKQELQSTGLGDEIVANCFFYTEQHKMHIFKLFIEKSKIGERSICWVANIDKLRVKYM